jgi:hypothetical protein
MKSNLETFSNSADFSQQIEFIVKGKGVSYIEAVELWCDRNGKDITVGADLVKKSPVIKSKIQAEAEELNLITKSARLPI